ncbi:hypothetical protein O5O45_00585 [Hahella aquimaris]|uniref:hypothetical protein n=1 Tax=Hahella sp. HNIBRBA332 TaxID=3015983 RepID=UPI00273C54F6|nr:hypothetical protein [Hahella sp. HNIBRBA332]WLQ14431.1 hypothetical protein O5O45_00585 [Hahella sp. HNIBRBA332]
MSPQIIARARQLSAWFHAFLCGLFLIPFFAYGLFTSSEDILPASKMLLIDWGPIILGSMALAYVHGKVLGHWYLPLEKKTVYIRETTHFLRRFFFDGGQFQSVGWGGGSDRFEKC